MSEARRDSRAESPCDRSPTKGPGAGPNRPAVSGPTSGAVNASPAPPGDLLGQAANTLRLSGRPLVELLDERDAIAQRQPEAVLARRAHMRWAYRAESVQVTLYSGGGGTALRLAARDLSAGGICLLHSSYVHPGTVCSVRLPRLDGGWSQVDGAVVRCVHFRGVVHDVGIHFASAIKIREFVAVCPQAGGFSLEAVTPRTLRGTALYVGSRPFDHALVRHYLRETEMRLLVASDLKEAMEMLGSGVDLAVCDLASGDALGASFLETLRAQGFGTPVIAIGPGPGEPPAASPDLITQASAVLTKPLAPEGLYRALAEFVVVGLEEGDSSCSLPPGHANLSLLPVFATQMHEAARALRAALADEDLERCRAVALQVLGDAPVMGFQGIERLARAALEAIGDAADGGSCAAALRGLTRACELVKASVQEQRAAKPVRGPAAARGPRPR